MSCSQSTVLIVCSNGRVEELRDILKVEFKVYWRKEEVDDSGALVWRNYCPAGSPESSHPALSGRCDVLFFHVSGNDPLGIPETLITRKEFAFSGPGLAANIAPAGRKTAIPIQRRFEVGDCPVKPRHVKELLEFLGESRHESPAFCRHEDSLSVLNSIAIICQAYAGALGSAHGAKSLSDWGGLKEAFEGAEISLQRTSDTLRPFLRQMETESWWKTRLGFWDAEAGNVNQAALMDVLVRLSHELELDVPLCKMICIDELWKAADASVVKKWLEEVSHPECTKTVLAFIDSRSPWDYAAKTNTAIEAFMNVR